jgi:AcrR family transcriptional regulator
VTSGDKGAGQAPARAQPRTRSLRRDAERNRRRIIEAARDVFAAQGLTPGLNEIARHAGLGVGTVYRHFADKDILVEAALHDEVDGMVALAEECQAADSAWDGLSRFLRQAIARQVADRGLRDALLGSPHLTRQAEGLLSRVAPQVAALLDRAHREGAVRQGVALADLLMIQLMVTEFANDSEEVRPGAYQRFLDLFIDSLRAQPGQQAIGEGLTEDEAILVLQHATHPSTTQRPTRP